MKKHIKLYVPMHILNKYGQPIKEGQVGYNISGRRISVESLLECVSHMKMKWIERTMVNTYLNALISSQGKKTFDYNAPTVEFHKYDES